MFGCLHQKVTLLLNDSKGALRLSPSALRFSFWEVQDPTEPAVVHEAGTPVFTWDLAIRQPLHRYDFT